MTSLETAQATLAQKRAYLKQQNRLYTDKFVQLPREDWPEAFRTPRPKTVHTMVWRNRDFLVQVIDESGHIRLTVNRTEMDIHGNWKANITWDELQHIKNTCGFPSHAAVEVFPPDGKVVNVANMRHLWVLPDPPPFMW